MKKVVIVVMNGQVKAQFAGYTGDECIAAGQAVNAAMSKEGIALDMTEFHRTGGSDDGGAGVLAQQGVASAQER